MLEPNDKRFPEYTAYRMYRTFVALILSERENTEETEHKKTKKRSIKYRRIRTSELPNKIQSEKLNDSRIYLRLNGPKSFDHLIYRISVCMEYTELEELLEQLLSAFRKNDAEINGYLNKNLQAICNYCKDDTSEMPTVTLNESTSITYSEALHKILRVKHLCSDSKSASKEHDNEKHEDFSVINHFPPDFSKDLSFLMSLWHEIYEPLPYYKYLLRRQTALKLITGRSTNESNLLPGTKKTYSSRNEPNYTADIESKPTSPIVFEPAIAENDICTSNSRLVSEVKKNYVFPNCSSLTQNIKDTSDKAHKTDFECELMSCNRKTADNESIVKLLNQINCQSIDLDSKKITKENTTQIETLIDMNMVFQNVFRNLLSLAEQAQKFIFLSPPETYTKEIVTYIEENQSLNIKWLELQLKCSSLSIRAAEETFENEKFQINSEHERQSLLLNKKAQLGFNFIENLLASQALFLALPRNNLQSQELQMKEKHVTKNAFETSL